MPLADVSAEDQESLTLFLSELMNVDAHENATNIWASLLEFEKLGVFELEVAKKNMALTLSGETTPLRIPLGADLMRLFHMRFRNRARRRLCNALERLYRVAKDRALEHQGLGIGAPDPRTDQRDEPSQ